MSSPLPIPVELVDWSEPLFQFAQREKLERHFLAEVEKLTLDEVMIWLVAPSWWSLAAGTTDRSPLAWTLGKRVFEYAPLAPTIEESYRCLLGTLRVQCATMQAVAAFVGMQLVPGLYAASSDNENVAGGVLRRGWIYSAFEPLGGSDAWAPRTWSECRSRGPIRDLIRPGEA